MAYYGIASNLVIYLTRKLHQGTVASANNVTNWTGTGFLMPVLGAYVAEAHLGRYWTFAISSAIYFLGMCLLTAAVSIPSLRPPPCDRASTAAGPENCRPSSALQTGVFFGALYVLTLGTGGTKPNISTIGADQFDDFDPEERAHKLSFFNWWMFSIYLGTLFSNVVLVYVQDNVGWSLGYGLPTVGLAVSLAIFFAGTPFYRHKVPQGSPFTKMARVLVAAARKWRVLLPEDPKELHELELREYTEKRRFKILTTNSLSFLNKAAVRTVSKSTPWTLCPVTQVEETKQMLRMLPVFVATLVPAGMTAQVNTLFVKQGTTLDRHVGTSRFQIPPASFTSFVTVSMLVSVVLYDRYFVKLTRAWTRNPRGISLLQRIGVALVLHVATMLVASLAERRRLHFAREHEGAVIPLMIFTLLPQNVLMGVAEAFLVPGKIEFFYDQAPEGMKSLGTSCCLATYGVGNFLSSALLGAVADVTGRGGRDGWILNDLDASRLDYYYALLAVISGLNLGLFLLVSKLYVYKAEVFESIPDSHLRIVD
ncbi:protein NRT1/ PTR FAMILY 5.2-like isoform X1 [Iris pallida]|uniref:Protein NRT1/ PTR FAMILY 5.2-like isoform X1 n=1 Tax=Iris pallida TaxID=29817 RepID=A0AAX6E3L4_IRIPA|nr:protein NRT1/ PTR FAMILY 5.2-like isoform X1 [Iris pallida]